MKSSKTFFRLWRVVRRVVLRMRRYVTRSRLKYWGWVLLLSVATIYVGLAWLGKQIYKQLKVITRQLRTADWRAVYLYARKLVSSLNRCRKQIGARLAYIRAHTTTRTHQYLYDNNPQYRALSNWKPQRVLNIIILVVYTASLIAGMAGNVARTFASDTTSNANFGTASDYTYDSGIEVTGNQARLKAQNYTTDVNTRALYHLDEVGSSVATDSSANGNDGTVANGTFDAGNLNNGISLDGRTSSVSASDSASLSLSQQNSLEAWTKLSSSLSAGSIDRRQGIIDKGAYKLYYDQETGKVTYELANSTSTTWTQQAGNDIKGSWDLNGKLTVNAQQYIDGNLYAGLGNAVGDAEVWKWDGTTWTKIGGDGINASWADQTFENVVTLNFSSTTLYAGLGSSAGDAEVWSCDTEDNCTTWTKIGGDGINSGWAVNQYEEVTSMTVMAGVLYIGLGLTANDARVYRWNGSAWTWVGGFGITGFTPFTTGYEAVYALTNDGTNVYASFGATAGDADVWRLTGTTWTQIGGDTLNSSWASALYETVISMRYVGSALYAGLGTTAGEAEVWRYNGTSWTKIGGDTVNSSWDSSSFEGVYSFTDDGTNLYAGLGASAGDNEVWRWNGTAWTKIGGDAVNSSFTNTHTVVQSLTYGDSTLYAGIQATAANSEVWAFTAGSWSRIGGGYVNNSWGFYNLQNVESMTVSGDYLYAGTGNTVAGNALVWRFDGSTWQVIGGQGLHGSWATNAYEDVMSMTSYGGNLYVGLGTTANDAEVWRYNGTAWTQVGGDSIASSWAAGFEEVSAMANFNGNLYVGLGLTANDAEVWRYNGTAWTKIGGDSLNSGWTTNFERVNSLTVYRNLLVAGLGASATDAETWSWNGTAWTKFGGDGLNGSWNTNYEQIESMAAYNGKLYAGLGNTTGDAEIWEWNNIAWTQIGGDGLSDSWLDGQYEQVKTLTTFNGNLYAGLGNGAGDGEVWEYSNGSWSKIAGSNVNSSWAANTIETVRSFSVYKGKLYAGLGDTALSDAAVWSYGNNGFLQSTTASQDTDWHHIAATYDGTTMRLYIDGVLDAQTVTALSLPDTTHPLLLGTTYGSGESNSGQGYLGGQLDEVRISNTARSTFITKPYATTAQSIKLAASVLAVGVQEYDDFAVTQTLNGGTIGYRISTDDGSTWKYWNGSAWTTSSSTSQTSTATEIDSNISTLPTTFYGIQWQAVMTSDGYQRTLISNITIGANLDGAAPSSNAGSLTAYKNNGGSTLASNSWTNGSSPHFTWTPAVDTGAGIAGYCLYLGQDNTADPATTKGLLGNSPEYPGSYCQFMVSGTSIDLATPGYLGTPLSTSTNAYYFLIKAIDKAGNLYPTTSEVHFRFDNTPPTNPGYITAPSGFINTKLTTLTWPTAGGSAASDGASGLVGLQYKINSSQWYGDSHSGTGDINDLLTNDGSYATVPTPDGDNIIEGINTVYFRAWDAAGNISSGTVNAVLKVNTAGAPSEPQNLEATPPSNTTNAFSFNWDTPTTFIGDEDNITYCYTVNTLPNDTSCIFTSPGVTSLGSGPYATQPGTNTLYVVARDESNNINYSSFSSINFTANTPSPGIPTNTDIVDVSVKNTSNWRLALTWDSPTYTGSGISNYRVYRSLNNVNFSFVGSSSSTTYIDANLSQQTYYYKVRACDNTNNCGADSTSVSMLPTGKFTQPADLIDAPEASDVTTKKASITWVTDRASDSKIAIGTSSGVYGQSEIGNSTQTSLHTIELDNLAAGTTYYFIAKWTDEDGNTGTSQEFTFTTAPAPAIKEVELTSLTLAGATIRFTSKGAAKVNIYYGLSDSFGGLKTINTSLEESQYNFTLDGLNDGVKYFYRISSFDAEGGEYAGNILSFNTPPRPRITNLRFQPVAGEPTSTQEISWLTNVPSTSIITYGKIGGNGTDLQLSELKTEHAMRITGLEDDSTYFIIAQSRDADGNLAVSDRQQFKTALDTRPPKVTEINVETSIRGTGAESRGQVVVSWKTDEPSTSQVAYAEGSNATTFNSKTAEDTKLTTEHLVIVSDLPTSKVYSIQPMSKDKGGNTAKGEVQPAIIGRATESVLTIILNTMQRVFGF